MIDLVIRREDPTPLHEQIANSLRRLILAQTLSEGEHLPPTRQLAQDLGVNRGTVVQAYERLRADGLAEGHVGRGTVVRPIAAWCEPSRASLSWPAVLGPLDTVSTSRAVEVATLFSEKDRISLAAGFPSAHLFPLQEVARITSGLLQTRGRDLLSDGPVEGDPGLCRVLAEGLACSPSQVFIVSGSQQGLYLLAHALIGPNDAVVTEVPTYLRALQVFREAGARVIGLPVDEGGVDLGMLEDVLSRTVVRFLYTVPSFQNPTGATLSLDCRRQVLELAYRYGVPIIEDDPYGLLAYDGQPPPMLRSLDRYGHVIYVSTCSKTLFPGLRVGWVVAPERVIDRLVPMKLRMDLFTSPLSQAVVAAFLGGARFDWHLERLRKAYRIRRDAMAAGLRRHCPKIAFSHPAGGYFIWGRLPQGVAARDLLREAAREGVTFLTGDFFYPEEQAEEAIRLTFASQPPERIVEGIQQLGRALRCVADRARSDGVKGPHPAAPIV